VPSAAPSGGLLRSALSSRSTLVGKRPLPEGGGLFFSQTFRSFSSNSLSVRADLRVMARSQQVLSQCRPRSYYAGKLCERAGVTLIVLAILDIVLNRISGFTAAGKGAS